MPKGLSSIKSAREEIDARRQAFTPQARKLKLPTSGDSADVRFLEQGKEIVWCWTHQLPPKPGRTWGDRVPCLDQDFDGRRIGAPCPCCEREIKRQFQGWMNLIWRNAPVYQRGDDNRMVMDTANNPIIIGKADAVVVWQSGITAFEELDRKDDLYRGLKSRDFRVTRYGTGLATKYSIEPVDPDGGPQPMSAADEELANVKWDLRAFVQIPSYNDIINQFGGTYNPSPEPAPEVNPFMRAR